MRLHAVLAVLAALMLIAPSPAAATAAALPPNTHFYAPDPNPGAIQQIAGPRIRSAT